MLAKSTINAALLILILLAPNSFAAPDTPSGDNAKLEYICTPCGCVCDDSLFTAAGNCPCCNMTLVLKSSIRKVAVLIFNGVELLDFTGPYDAFMAAQGRYELFTVGLDTSAILTGHGTLKVIPAYGIDNSPKPDILVIPGGGVGEIMRNQKVMAYVKNTAANAEIVLSVCSGSFILAKAGLLDGLKATAHESDVDELEKFAQNTTVVRGQRYVDNGKIICAGGISSGIDAALYIIEKQHNKELADSAARYLQHLRRSQ